MNITKKDISYFAKIIGVLLAITMFIAALLSFVNMVTKEKIAENERTATAEAIGKLFPTASAPAATDLGVSYSDNSFTALYEVKDGDTLIGYYAEVTPKGFKGAVNMLVGISLDGKVCGTQIISHGETVGIGDKIENDSFLSRFIGASGSASYKKGADGTDGVYDGISGATYSSKAVIAGIDTALKAYNEYIGG